MTRKTNNEDRIDFTVAIPTYNGAHLLPKLLERLSSQNIPLNFSWEIIVIDNNSSDHTAALIKEYQANWVHAFPLRYYFELEQGAAFARIRAVLEAKGELIGFLDDDNLPNLNWVSAAYTFAQEHPKAGAYGGKIHGSFEVPPPENFKRIQSFLAIRDRGNSPHLYQPDMLILPPSASLVIRKQAWVNCLPKNLVLTGPQKESSFLRGEDYELLLYLSRGGWEIWYNPAMETEHLIPRWRLERHYLLSLVQGSGLCISHLRMIGLENWRKPLILLKIMLGSLKRIILHWLKYKGELQTDLIAACEMEFFISTFISPLYYLGLITPSQKTSKS